MRPNMEGLVAPSKTLLLACSVLCRGSGIRLTGEVGPMNMAVSVFKPKMGNGVRICGVEDEN